MIYILEHGKILLKKINNSLHETCKILLKLDLSLLIYFKTLLIIAGYPSKTFNNLQNVSF